MTNTQPPLEDSYIYILAKAQKGLGLTDTQLTAHTEISPELLEEIKSGGYNDNVPGHSPALLKLAFALNLNGPALVAMAKNCYQPTATSLPIGLAMFTTPFGAGMTVNAYLVWDEATKRAITIDTGSSCQPMLQYASKHHLTFAKHVVTHTHLDHLADIDTLLEKGQGLGYGPAIENPLGLTPIKGGDGLIVGELHVRVLGTHGHTPGGLSYYITGLETPIVVVGDALFAGSMGGVPSHAYQTALRNNREHLLTLPKNTIICPGHGPLTTVGQERQHNPFFSIDA